MKKHVVLCVIMTLMTLLSGCRASTGPSVHKVGQVRVGAAYDVYVEGNYAYVTNNDGVVIVDVQNPRKPRKEGAVSIGELAMSVFVLEDLAYLAGAGQGLFIADIGDPTNPEILGHYYDGGMANQVRVADDFAFVADGPDGLEILDVRDPRAPVKVAQLNNGGDAVALELVGDTIYLANSQNGLEIIDVANPHSPKMIRAVSGTGGVQGVYVGEDWLYVACHGQGIKIVNTTGDQAFRVIGTFFDGDKGEALDVWAAGIRLYVADNRDGLEVLDVSDPTAPYEIAQFGGSSRTRAVHNLFSDGDFIYLADGWSGLVIVVFEDEH